MSRPLESSDLDTLARELRGPVLRPGDPAYEESRRTWNGAIDKHPGAVARPADAADVAGAIGFANRLGVEVSICGGGHSFAGFSLTEGGLMIDLRDLNAVSVDAGARRARAGGGVKWQDLDAATAQHSLAVTGGFISHTGIAGLTLGGGMGWLTGKAGLSSDNLLGAEVVTADGRKLHADADHQSDLFWGLRGGGGNFGVVTEFEFRLHEHNPMANLGIFAWGVDRGRDALRLADEFTRTLPRSAGCLVAPLSLPPAPFVPDHLKGATAYAILVAGFETAEEHLRLVQPLREAGPMLEFITPIPYAAMQQMFNEGAAWGFHGYEKALWMDGFSEDAIDVITEEFPKKQSPLSFMPCFVMGGAYRDTGEEETAFGGPRGARFAVNIAGITPTGEGYAGERDWVRSFWTRLQPHAMGNGSYVNFMNEADEDRIRASYGAAKYERLANLKAEFDPENVFHLNANIKPAGIRV